MPEKEPHAEETAQEKGPNVEIATFQEILDLKPSIPHYQRPYSWTTKHVYQLLDDLLTHQKRLNGQQRYRMGTIVLHRNQKEKEIVDGQQRLVTLCLILQQLTNQNSNTSADAFLEKAYSTHLKHHRSSLSRLKENWIAIENYLKQRLQDSQRDALKSFIENRCDFIVVELSDLSEAFQFFDSQNARGKSLEPYDLLKAFHLREMRDVPQQEKEKCVERWEKSVDEGTLKELFDDYLYRIRRWMRGESGLEFTKDEIDLFKGVNLSDNSYDFPYTLPYRIIESFFASGIAKSLEILGKKVNIPFQIGQTIINGKRFFDYVAHYQGLLNFIKKDLVESKQSKIINVLESYEGRHRTGDRYTRNLFNAALLCFVDRFGKKALDEDVIRQCYAWAYAIRFEKERVRKVTMDEKGKEPDGLIRRMPYFNHRDEIVKLPIPFPELKTDDEHPASDLDARIKKEVFENEQ